MSRVTRFVASLSSAYVTLAASMLYISVGVPLALKFLPKEQYGLWALVLQTSGYLSLLDLGVSQAVARLLIDYKDNFADGKYGAILKASWVVFAIQAVLVVTIGAFVGFACAGLFGVPPNLRGLFGQVFFAQCVAAAISLALHPLFVPLWSHQRSDLANWFTTAQTVVALLVLWISLSTGLGLWSFFISSFAGGLVYLAGTICSTFVLGLLPPLGRWGRLARSPFNEIFGFGSDVFFISLGNQVISASQIILATRLISLDAAVVWTICTKTFTFGQQVVWRILDFSISALSEMFVRQEDDKLQRRLGEIAAITVISAGFLGVLGAVYSREVIWLWTRGAVTWAMQNDIGAAGLLFCISITRCLGAIHGLTKRIKVFKYVILIEASLLITLSILTVPHVGLLGILLSSLVANLLCTGWYSFNVVQRRFYQAGGNFVYDWLAKPTLCVGCFAILSFALYMCLSPLDNQTRLFIGAPISAIVGAFPLLRFGLPTTVRNEIVQKLQAAVYRLKMSKSAAQTRTP
jgi:O-antigen/teichoic acid export membrane protein